MNLIERKNKTLMKKSTKLISLILAVVMVFSASCVSAAAAAIPAAAQNSIETLIQNKNLAELVGWLITNLNGAKTNITGTVLRLVYNFAGDKIGGEGKDTFNMTDEQLAKTLLDWLDANLPEWTKDITEQSWWGTVTSIVNLLGITLKLDSVDGILETAYSVCEKANSGGLIGAAVGDLKDLNGSALKGVKRSGGDLKVIYALLQWINDNQKFIKSFVIGGISSDGIKLGDAIMSIIGDSLNDVNKIVKNIPDFAKGWVYLLVDGYAEKPDIKDNPKGGWGVSEYKDYSADEMLAAALINLINDNYKKSREDTLTVIPKAEANEVLNLSFYGLLTKYGPDLYARFAVGFLNGTLKDLIGKLKDYPEAAKAFNMDYTFTKDSFNAAFADASSTGFLGQFNNIICIILKTVLSSDAYKAIAPAEGGNDKLNGNLTKVCRYVLPILASYSKELGFDFTKFTADAVKEMELPEMAVAVLKIFFPTWFKDGYGKEPDLLKNAQTLAQLGAVAMKYVVQFPDLLNWYTNGFDVTDLTTKITADKIASMDDETCEELAAGIGARLGAYALDQQSKYTHFTLSKDAAKMSWRELCDDIVDWALNFVKGFPAVSVKHLTAKMGEYDGYGPFYKINVILNELIDFSFLSNVGDETFKLDVETLLFDTILNNAFNFDISAIIGVFEKNSNEGNILNGKVIPGVIGLVDRILTALFTHTCGATKEFEKELSCTEAMTGSYDVKNGHYVGETGTKAIENHDFVEIADKNLAPTCGATGYTYYECSKCGEPKKVDIPATGKHDYKEVKETQDGMVFVYKVCNVCGDQTEPEILDPGKTDPDPGKTDPDPGKTDPDPGKTTDSDIPENLGDVDGNGEVESGDARLALRASVKLEDIKEGTAAFKAADIDGNGTIESSDARLILRLSVKLEKLEDIKANYKKSA